MGFIIDILKKNFLEQPKAEGVFGTGAKFKKPAKDERVYHGLGVNPVDWIVGRDIRKIMAARLVMNHEQFHLHYLKGDKLYEDMLSFAKKHLALDYILAIFDQGRSSSCVAQAVCWYQTAKNFFETQAWDALSPKDLYPYIRVFGGGAYINIGFTRKNNDGIVPEAILTSYPDGNPPTEDYMKKKHLLNHLGLLHRFVGKGVDRRSIVHYNDIDKVAEVIRDYGFVVSGVRGVNNGTWRTINPVAPIQLPGEPKPVTWGHAIVFVGYGTDELGKYIEIVNSWGLDVGDQGTQKLREDWFTGGWAQNMQFDTDLGNIHEHENTYNLVKDWMDKNWKRVRSDYHRDVDARADIRSRSNSIIWKAMQEALNLPEWTRHEHYDYHQFRKSFK